MIHILMPLSKRIILFCLSAFLLHIGTRAQTDSLKLKDSAEKLRKVDTAFKPMKATRDRDSLRPRKAAIRSAILPGLGQIYNRKYWKLPLVYAAVGIPGYLIFDNKRWYDRSRYALAVIVNKSQGVQDSMDKVHPQLRALVVAGNQNSVINYRNEFRKNMDYSVLFTLLFWGLNVVDATVDAHLRDFDVSDDLSLRIQPALLPGNAVGVGLVFTIGKKPVQHAR
jgi:hypothetical protein